MPRRGAPERVDEIDPGVATPARSRFVRLVRIYRTRWFGSATLRGLGPALPLLAFLGVAFVLPMLLLVYYAFLNPELRLALPHFVRELGTEVRTVPGPDAYRTLAADLLALRARHGEQRLLRFLYAQHPQTWALLRRTLNRLPETPPAVARVQREGGAGAWKRWFLEVDAAWGQAHRWQVIRRLAAPATVSNFTVLFDARLTADGALERAPPGQRPYLRTLLNTFYLAAVACIATLVLGYPLAWMLARMRAAVADRVLLLVLLPVWTSLLVRTYAWIALLQNEGLLNDALAGLGLRGPSPMRWLQTRFGVYVAVINLLLPLMILPIYASMRALGPRPLQAALGLGARPWTAFRTIVFPHTVSGIATGCLLVITTSVGYYVTPLLIGGPRELIMSTMAASDLDNIDKWGVAAALCVLMGFTSTALYALYLRICGLRALRTLAP